MCDSSYTGFVSCPNKSPSPRKEQRTNNFASAQCFRMVIQRNFDKMVDLPKPSVWSFLPKCLHSCLLVSVRRRQSFFFSAQPKLLPSRCVLTSRGYLLVYAKEKKLKGYAVNIGQALRVKVFTGSAGSHFCIIRIKWKFGELLVSLYKDQISEWCSNILDAFCCKRRSRQYSSQTILLKDVATQTPTALNLPTLSCISSEDLDEKCLEDWNGITCASVSCTTSGSLTVEDSREFDHSDSLSTCLLTPPPVCCEVVETREGVQPPSVVSSPTSNHPLLPAIIDQQESETATSEEFLPFVSLLARYGSARSVQPKNHHINGVSFVSVQKAKELFESKEVSVSKPLTEFRKKEDKWAEHSTQADATDMNLRDSQPITVGLDLDGKTLKTDVSAAICFKKPIEMTYSKDEAKDFGCDSHDISSHWQRKLFESCA